MFSAGRRNIVGFQCPCWPLSSKDGTEPLVEIGYLVWRIWLQIGLFALFHMPAAGLVPFFQFKERREDTVEIEARGLRGSRRIVRLFQQNVDQIHPSPGEAIRLLPRESVAGLLNQLSLGF
jgi:hypothetical protein